jgi:hypothetical protein
MLHHIIRRHRKNPQVNVIPNRRLRENVLDNSRPVVNETYVLMCIANDKKPAM